MIRHTRSRPLGSVSAPARRPPEHPRAQRLAPVSAGLAVLVAALGAPPAQAAPAGPVITTVAGTGDGANFGDDGPARLAGIKTPTAMATAPDGTLYLVSGLRIRSIDQDGTIHTVAGTGKAGLAGDGGPATKATFSQDHGAPSGLGGIAVGPHGTLYITDTDNQRIRAVDPHTHRISTVAGNGPTGEYKGSFAGDGGPADKARLSNPVDVAVGPHGTLYIADRVNYRIRSVDPDSHRIRTVAGTHHSGDDGSSFFPKPGDTGSVATKTFVEPNSVAVDRHGTVYFSDGNDQRVRAVDPKKDRLTTLAGEGGKVGLHRLAEPGPLTVAHDTLYITDATSRSGAGRARVVYTVSLGKHPTLTRFAGSTDAGTDSGTNAGRQLGDGGRPTSAVLTGAHVAVGKDGTVYLSDLDHNRIRAVSKTPIPNGTRPPSRHITTYPDADSRVGDPTSIAVADDGTVYVLDGKHQVVDSVDSDDGTIETIAGSEDRNAPDEEEADDGPATDIRFDQLTAIALGPHDGTLYLASYKNVYAVDLSKGSITSLFSSTNGKTITGIAAGPGGTVYVSRSVDGVCAIRHGSSCKNILPAGSPGEQRTINQAGALTVGQDGTVYVADSGRIVALEPKTGQVRTVAGTVLPGVSVATTTDGIPAISVGGLTSTGIDVADNGTLYISDQANHRIRAVDPKTGTMSTVAGSDRYKGGQGNITYEGGGFGGDGGSARHARLDNPADVALGPHGALYIADAGNHRIRVVGDVALPEAGTGIGWYLATGAVLLVLIAGAVLLLRYRRARQPDGTAPAPAATGSAEGPEAGSDDAPTSDRADTDQSGEQAPTAEASSSPGAAGSDEPRSAENRA